MAVNNPYFYSTMGTAPSTQIADSSDNPHSGLIKALSVGMTGNYAIKAGNDFAITIASASTVTVDSGVVFRDGAYQAVSASGTLTLGTTAANSTYSLIVVNSSNALAIRPTPTTNAVPAYTLGDIPVALLLYTGSDVTMEIQFLTANKRANSITLGYEDSSSNDFTEGLTGYATSDKTIFRSKGAGRKVRFVIGNTNSDEFEIFSDTDLDADEGDNQLFSVRNDGLVTFLNGGTITNPDVDNLNLNEANVTVSGNLKIGASGQHTVTQSSNDMVITNTVNDKVIQFIVKDGGGNDKTATLTAATTGDVLQLKGVEEVIIVALSDETTDLATGTGKASFHMPFAMTLTKVKASVNTAPTGASIIVDINEGGSTIFSTQSNRPTIAASGTTANAAGINDANLADNALITFDIDQVGSSDKGKGLKVTLYGYRT